MTDLALDTESTTDQRDYLGLVKSSADSLLHVINDILDFSKIEAGKLELEETEFGIRDLFGDTLKTLAIRADKKHLELSVRVSPEVPQTLIGDPTRLRQLIVNLVGNAIKSTEVGNVNVDADIEKESNTGMELHFRVSDTGIGIPLEKQRIIFDSFAQADGSTTRRFGGTGLGLTISRQLVRLMGGRIWVESEMGTGSTFHFTATFRRGVSPPSTQERIAVQTFPGLDVLVVDDNALNRNILAEMLTNWRMNPILAENGEGALRAMETARAAGLPFRVVLLDAQMPEMDGFTVMERIRGDRFLADSVLLMVSADRHLADASRCRDLGVRMFLTKPIGQSELLDAILSVLGTHVAEERLIETPVLVLEKSDGKHLNILLAEDNPVNQKLAIRLLEKGGHKVTLAESGKEALTAWKSSGSPGFDMVLMDIQMPEMDGMETTAIIRELEKSSGKHIPIIAMTAHAMRGDKERCLSQGMDGYISKPVHSEGLFAEIERCLSGITERTTMTMRPREQSERLDRASILDRVEGDHALLAEMVNLFVEDAPNLIAAMHAALQQGDMPVLARAAHSMKGAASNFSAQLTQTAASELEKNAAGGDAELSKASLIKLEQAVGRLLPILADLCQGVSS